MAETSCTQSIPVTSRHLDPVLFYAIMLDKEHIVRQDRRFQLEHQTTPNGNTVLHVAAQNGKAGCVNAILELCHSLLLRLNDQEETALRVAAKRGDIEIVKVKALICSAKSSAHKDIKWKQKR